MGVTAIGPTCLPHELFHYSPVHEVLICTSCHYAVQPAAISRHLKEIHRIYRGFRRPFIAYASRFSLKRPESVSPPRAPDFPVPLLSVEQGWQCEAPRCGYLCVSLKRMQSHWPAQHSRKGDPSRDWTAVPLQSFFRGNFLRYFTWPCTSDHQETATPLTRQLGYGCSTSSSFLSVEKMQKKYKLHQTDVAILEHYFDDAYKSFVTNVQTKRIWLNVVPKLAYESSFLLHGVLACTALHLAHIHPPRRQYYNFLACAHQDIALPLFRSAIDYPTEDNCDAIVTFAYLLVVYSFATDSDVSNQSLLLVDDHNDGESGKRLIIPQWLHFIRVGCSMLCNVWDRVESGPVSALAAAWDIELGLYDTDLPYLEHFLSFIPNDSSWSSEIVSIYRNAAISLAQSLAYTNTEGMASFVTTWNILGSWPMRIESEYMDLLYERHPGALLLLAHYCIILKRLEKCWYFEGRAVRLMTSIMSLLDDGWHPFIQDVIDSVLGQVEQTQTSLISGKTNKHN
ncbi:hypothetical protein BGW36DRAFT_303266 [Talaromyces proteolyticus]|uniref:C2H2-type domain-containing protein n=1 Tax=Talaromyces proteolyticus TaxID=1131652 RepID=A0AAD4KHQ1_9EURO|nr:uncharacterized protein BGW36DRAFT_303266 [Talaromyces proteolyticus]KAH8691981.1 hypothetical protein BGW36DRAFT_303266 [Talaromyces proteolyticus]